MGCIPFEYFFEYVHQDEVKILRVVAMHRSIALEILRETYPKGDLKLLEMRPLDT
jgi:hypothetical protein